MTLLETLERLIGNCGERFSSSVLWRFFDRHELTFKNVWPRPVYKGVLPRLPDDQSASTYPASRNSLRPSGDTRADMIPVDPESALDEPVF